jgi:hypothetical protein
MMLDESVRFRGVFCAQVFGIPNDSFAGAECDVPQEDGLGERAGVIEVAGGFGTGFAGLNPFVVVAD